MYDEISQASIFGKNIDFKKINYAIKQTEENKYDNLIINLIINFKSCEMLDNIIDFLKENDYIKTKHLLEFSLIYNISYSKYFYDNGQDFHMK